MARLIQLVGAWYAPAYSLAIRVVQPAAFGALLTTLLWIILRTLGTGDTTYVLLALGSVLLYTAHSFVLTPPSAVVPFVLVLAWIVIITEGLAEDPWLGILFLGGVVSAAIRLLAIVRSLGQRRRTGLLHLAVPALAGTVVGIASPIVGLALYALDRPDDARFVAVVMLSLGLVAVACFSAATYLVERSDSVVRDWCRATGLKAPAVDDGTAETYLGPFIRGTGIWKGGTAGARISVVSGTLKTGYADLPCARLTSLNLRAPATKPVEQKPGKAKRRREQGSARRRKRHDPSRPSVWIRSRSMTLDTIVPRTMATRRLQTESIEVEGRHEIHVAARVDPVVAMAVVDPRVVDVARGLGTLQVLRHDASVTVYDVGTATTPERLDDMLRIARESAIAFDLLEPSLA